MATDTNINQLVINKLTRAQYAEAKEAGLINETELYMITDADESGGTGGVQPDWNQNDEAAPDYVKNRTHYTDIELKPFVTNRGEGEEFVDKIVIFNEGGFNQPFYDGVFNEDGGLFFDNAGKYRVVWDGVDYDCEVHDENSYYGLGRIGGEGEYPFAITDGENGANITAYTADGEYETGGVTHTVSVYELNETVHKLDEKYLPESVLGDKVEAVKNLNKSSTGFDTLLEYMASRYNEHVVVYANVSGFSDLPTGVTSGQAVLNMMDGILTATLHTRTAVYTRGTNSLTSWTGEWRTVYDSDNVPSASDIGALPLDGGVAMTGHNLLLRNGLGRLYCDTGIVGIDAFEQANVTDANGRQILLSAANKDALVAAVVLRDWNDGAYTDYKLYGEHNPGYTYGTTDLEAGVSPLETGKLYFVYE